MRPGRLPKFQLSLLVTCWKIVPIRRSPGLDKRLRAIAAENLGQFHAAALLGYVLSLDARRRMGKTEFLTKDLSPAARDQGYVVGYCNLWQEGQNPADAIAEAIHAAAQPRRLLGKVRAWRKIPVSTVKISAKVGALAEGSTELGFKESDKADVGTLPAALAALAGPKRGQLGRELGGPLVAQYQQGGTAARDLLRKGNARGTKLLGLRRWPSRVVLSESVDRDLLDAERLTRFEERRPRRNAARVTLLLGKSVLYRPSPVAVRNETDVPGQASLAV
jgi:hypothetical protein